MRARGFTLLEVLVAFTVLGLILGATLAVLGGGLRAVALDRDYGQALAIARSRLAELEASAEPGEASGEAGGRYRWQVTVEPYEPEEGPVSSRGVRALAARVVVRWEDGARERAVRLATLVLAHE